MNIEQRILSDEEGEEPEVRRLKMAYHFCNNEYRTRTRNFEVEGEKLEVRRKKIEDDLPFLLSPLATHHSPLTPHHEYHLNSIAFTGCTFLTNNVGSSNASTQTMRVATQTSSTCHQIISTGASRT